METDPKIESIEIDTATQAFFLGIKYIRNYLIFICTLLFLSILFLKLDVTKMKDLDKESMEFLKFLLETSYSLVIWIFVMLVGSFIFKGKGGSKFFESIGNIIEKVTGMYKAKASSKFGVTDNKQKE